MIFTFPNLGNPVELENDFKEKQYRPPTILQLFQVSASLAKVGRPVTKPAKVKKGMKPVDSQEITFDLTEINKHRKQANILMKERLDEVTQKYKAMSQKLYLPYVVN